MTLRTTKAAAASLDIHPSTLRRWIAAAAGCPVSPPWVVPPGGRRRWRDDSAILRWLEEVERWQASRSADAGIKSSGGSTGGNARGRARTTTQQSSCSAKSSGSSPSMDATARLRARRQSRTR